jgi:hypothetical protein
MIGLTETAGAGGTVFTDTVNHWAGGLIAAAAEKGLVRGFDDGSVQPDAPVSRQELAVILHRALPLPSTIDYNQSLFFDVNPYANPWSNSAIVALAVHHVLSGYPDGGFHPQDNVTRAEAAKMFDIALEITINYQI